MKLKMLCAAACLTAFGTGLAHAQAYPTKTITMIVPFAAGGPTDTVARLVAQSMGNTLKQQIIVENVGGAGGTIGAARAAKAAPDGYTLFLHHIGQSTAPALYRKLRYDAITSFEPIGLITDVPMTLVAQGNFPAKDMKELITYVKANKDKVTYANAGLGSASHLCGMLFMTAIGVELTTVPYKGTGPAMNDLLGGQVDFMCDQTTNTTSQIKGGKIKAYGVTTKTPVASLPNLPTLDEGWPARLRSRRLAWPVRAERHAEANHRHAVERPADRAARSERESSASPTSAPSRSLPIRPRRKPCART